MVFIAAVACSCGGLVDTASSGPDSDASPGATPPVPAPSTPPSPGSPTPGGCAVGSLTTFVDGLGKGFNTGILGWAHAIALGDTDAFYLGAPDTRPTSSTPAVIHRVAKTGGTPTVFAQTTGIIEYLLMAGDLLYWARDAGPWPNPIDYYIHWRNVKTSDEGSFHMPAGWRFDYMAATEDAVYIGVRTIPDTSPINGVYRFRHDGTYEQLVVVSAAGDLFAEGDDLWYLTSRLRGDLLRRSLATGAETVVAKSVSGPLVHDAKDVLVHNDTGLVAFSKATNALDFTVAISSGVYDPFALLGDAILAVNSTFQPTPPDATGLFRTQRDGSCSTRVRAGDPPLWLQSDGRTVFAHLGSSILAYR